ncbi:MAG: PAS domain S-box protein, partial [Magnetococcales bacterium]|nr:PAS domain S-box protein [Magnetococcales bacterium]
DRSPFASLKDGKPEGFSIDYLDLLATKLALPIRYVPLNPGEDATQLLLRGGAEIVLDPLPPPEHDAPLVFTPPYPGAESGMALPLSLTILRDLLQQAMAEVSTEEMNALRNKWPQASSRAGSERGARQEVQASDTPEERLQLTPEEGTWLKAHPKVRLGVLPGNLPFEAIQNGKFTGLAADFAALVANMTGLNLMPVTMHTPDEGGKAVASGEVDLVPVVVTFAGDGATLPLTQPYITFPLVIVSHRAAPYIGGVDDLTGLKVAVVADSPAARLLAKQHPELKLHFMPTVTDALKALDGQQVGALVENLASVSRELSQLNLEQVRIVAPTPYQVGLAMGVRPDWPLLRSIVQKALDRIESRDKIAIRNTWMAVHVQIGVELRSLLLWGVPGILAVALFVAFIVVWNRRLGREIVERKQAEAALEAAEERSRLLLDSVGEGIFGLDREGCFHFINPAGATMLGVEARAVIGQRFCMLNNHDSFDGAACLRKGCGLRQEILSEERIERASAQFFRRGSGVFPVEYSSRPIRKEGDFIGTVVVFRDISERLRTERQIRILGKAVEQSPVSIVITDPQANIEYVNPTFTVVSGYAPEEVIGQNPRVLKSGKMDEKVYNHLWECLKRCETWKGEFLNRRKNGDLYWESTIISPILTQNGEVEHFLASKEDITRRKEAEERLQEALQLISGSIQYASRIQRSILTPPQVLTEVLPEHFVLWEPRDVVGGDMYWYRPWITGT